MAPKRRLSGPSVENDRAGQYQSLHLSPSQEAIHTREELESPRTSRTRSDHLSATLDDRLSPPIIPEENSRPESSSSMRTSATPLEGPITYTPTTHRVSKAKKGKRVHACDFPGCGKVFTRNEHKRRHEANHNPDVAFACDREGCGRTFHRPDLLQRHQERHDMESGSQSSPRQRPSSNAAISAEVPMTMPIAHPIPVAPNTRPRRPAEQIAIEQLVHAHDLRAAQLPFAARSMSSDFSSVYQSSDNSIYSTPENSPSNSDRFPSHRQSIVTVSSDVFAQNVPSPSLDHTMVPSMDYLPPTTLPSVYTPLPSVVPLPLPFSDLDGHDWTVIRRELSIAFGVTTSDDGTGIFHTVRWQQCLNCYWQFFHPFLPIVHQPTFFATKPSPLLTGVMVAIGSQYDSRPDAQQYSLTLLEVTAGLLRGRDAITTRSRLPDMQIVLLLEILTRFRARRTEVGVSPRFRTLYTAMSDARHWSSNSPLAVFRSLPPNCSAEDLSKAHKFWVDAETKRRILQAASMVDLENHILFEQPLTIGRQHGLPILKTSLGSELPLPCHSDLWESSPVEKWAELALDAHEINVKTARRSIEKGTAISLDDFQRRIVMTSWLVDENKVPRTPETPTYSLSRRFAPLPDHTEFSCHGLAAFQATRLRDLLTVSGESWLFGQKLDNEDDFNAARHRLREWVDAAEDANTALWHATKLLRVAVIMPEAGKAEQGELSQFRKISMLHEEWTIYVATLICWAYGFRASQALSAAEGPSTAPSVISEANSLNSSTSGSSTHPSLMDALDADSEMCDYLRATDVEHAALLSSISPQVIGRTAGLLETVRMRKLSGQMGGLLNEAERVLYRLVEGKSRLSHF